MKKAILLVSILFAVIANAQQYKYIMKIVTPDKNFKDSQEFTQSLRVGSRQGLST